MEPQDILDLRQRLRLAQHEFASVLGVDQRSISFWERGERSPTPPYVALMERIRFRLNAEDEAARREKMRTDLLTAGALGVGMLMIHLFSSDNDE